MKPQQAWHTKSVLPVVINRGVNITNYEVGVGQLQTLMMQFQRGLVPGNYAVVEYLCRYKAKKLNELRPTFTKPVDERTWFGRGIAGLHRSKKQHEAEEAAKEAAKLPSTLARDHSNAHDPHVGQHQSDAAEARGHELEPHRPGL